MPCCRRRRRRSPPPAGVRVAGVPERLGDHRVALVDRPLHPGRDDRLAGEPVPVADPDVDGEDDGVGGGDGLGERGLAPAEPWVSTAISTPAFAAAASSASAAM